MKNNVIRVNGNTYDEDFMETYNNLKKAKLVPER